MFGAGTAAMVSSIASFRYKGMDYFPKLESTYANYLKRITDI